METNEVNALIEELTAHNRLREDMLRGEMALGNQIGAIARRLEAAGAKSDVEVGHHGVAGNGHEAGADLDLFFSTYGLRTAMESLTEQRRAPEKAMKKIVKRLPIWTRWAAGVRGLGELSVAQLVAEAGPLSRYATHSKLWKRFGLAPLKGRSACEWRKRGGLSVLEWEALGYSPRRRSIVFLIGDNLLRARSPYKAVYDARKEVEAAKDPEATAMAIHRRAKRYMEKKLLRDMWTVWRRLEAGLPAGGGVAAEAA